MRTLAALLSLSISTVSFAADARIQAPVAHIGQVEVQIPAGFSGPERKFPNAQSELHNYVEIVGGGRAPTVIQLTHVTVPQALPNLSEQDRYLAASDFLDGFLAVFGKNASHWARSSNEKIRLGGYLGARAKWTGSLNGVPCTGVMYLLVLGKDSFAFHTFGSDVKPNSSLRASIQAIEALRVHTADKSLERALEK